MTRTLLAGGDPGPITLDGDVISQLAEESRPDLVVDAAGLRVAPGFVDLQINGGFGIDLSSGPGSIWDLGRLLPRHGVTAFLPTIVSTPRATTDAALAAIRRRPPGYIGAEPIGLHLEGPMLNSCRRGAHVDRYLASPSPEIIERWSRRNGVVMVTLAPELPAATAIITELAARGVVVAAGHSDATAAEAAAGLDAGITVVTHLFNAMAPFDHRDPGLVGVTLARSDVRAGLIADGVHVDPVAVATAWRAKGPDGLALVTDAVAPMGLGPGRYRLGSAVVVADQHSVRSPSGTIAGSLLTMDRALRNLVDFTGCPVDDAVTAAATTPAEAIGQVRRGRLEPGGVADLTLLDADLEVAITVCAGRIAYVAPSAEDRIVGDRGAG